MCISIPKKRNCLKQFYSLSANLIWQQIWHSLVWSVVSSTVTTQGPTKTTCKRVKKKSSSFNIKKKTEENFNNFQYLKIY